MVAPWVVGMLINLCGNICINIGTNAVKYDHSRKRMQDRDESMMRSGNSSVVSSPEQLDGATRSNNTSPISLPSFSCPAFLSRFCTRLCSHGRWWYIGWLMFTIGNIGNFISLSFTPQSLLAALGSVQFIMNVICEWFFSGQRVTPRILKATVMIVIGNTLIVAFASHQSEQLTVDELFLLYFEPAFDIYCVILFFLIVCLYVYYEETKKRLRNVQHAVLAYIAAGGQLSMDGSMGMGMGVGTASAIGSSASGQSQLLAEPSALSSGTGGHSSVDGMTQHGSSGRRFHAAPVLAPLPPALPSWRVKLLPFSYAAISAIIGTQSVLLAKSTSELLRTSAQGNQQFSSYFTYVIIVAWAASMVFWLYRMDTALRKFDGPFIVPVLQVVWTLFSIIGGGIYFQEFNRMPGIGITFFTIGVLIVISGVYLLAPQPQPGETGTRGMVLADQLHHVELATMAAAQDLHDIEMRTMGASPYTHDGGGSMYMHHSHSSSSGKDHDVDQRRDSGSTKTPAGMAAVKLTRVASTGRMRMEAATSDATHDHDILVDVSPERDSEYTPDRDRDRDHTIQDGTTDDETNMKDRADLPRSATGLQPHAADAIDEHGASRSETLPPPRSSTSSSVSAFNTPPLRPQNYWPTPPRHSINRPVSSIGSNSSSGGSRHFLHHHHHLDPPSVATSSLPPSPALQALSYDVFNSLRHDAGVKRGRAMSLGFSMPLITLTQDDEKF